ncbi:MAG: hypothetical protein ACREDV_07965, partial [Methylocella sp.]
MAISNKAQDPAAAALLAIEEALKLPAAGENPGPAEANPGGAASPDKAQERTFGKRDAAMPRFGPSKPERGGARKLEPRPAANGGDRLTGLADENSAAPGATAPGAEIQPPERPGGA